MTQAVKKLEDANVGDFVWFYDGNANRYDENKKYIGRGKYRLAQVEGKTRQSFEVQGTKFTLDGDPRIKNGFTPNYGIYGQDDREAKEWLDNNKYKLISYIQGVNDADALKKVAELVGYEEVK